MIFQCQNRRVSIKSKKVLVITIGSMVFLAGCAIAIYRDIEDEKSRDLQESTRGAIDRLLAVYGRNSGAISLFLLQTEPGRLKSEGPFDGKVALIRITIYDSDEIDIKVPGETEFDDHPKSMRETATGFVPLDVGNSRIMPAGVEVVLYG